MDHSLVISQSVDIRAGAATVWEGLTNPEIIKEYLYGADTITDWKVGSEIIFQGEFEGQEYRDKGIILENEFQKKISYTYWSGFSGMEDIPENYSVVTYTLTPIDNEHTRLTWTQRGYASKEAHEHSEKGMQPFLEQVRTIFERDRS